VFESFNGLLNVLEIAPPNDTEFACLLESRNYGRDGIAQVENQELKGFVEGVLTLRTSLDIAEGSLYSLGADAQLRLKSCSSLVERSVAGEDALLKVSDPASENLDVGLLLSP
jgi:hypothetical protein